MDKVRAPRAVNIAVTVLFVIAFFILLLSLSISLPILNRWFYYIQIDTLGLERASGHSYEEIKQAYDRIAAALPDDQISELKIYANLFFETEAENEAFFTALGLRMGFS